nr:putative wd repeat-containing protein c4f8.11 [Quercus suber]
MNRDEAGLPLGGATEAAPIPSAPPLPVSRPLQRARAAAYRFIGYPDRSRVTDAHGEPDSERFIRGSIGGNRFTALGETQNATTTHKTGLEINTIAINESGSHALLGGKEIFKTIRVENGICAEELNLRTKIRSTPRQASGGPRQIYSIDIADVAWAKGEWADCVAAATSSGKIILYNIGHAELQATQLHDHSRQVHKVTFNPHRGNLLLSGSQDGTVRLWDIRSARNQVNTLQSKRTYSGQSDGVRDVKWSPTEGVDFALATDSGVIQRWDLRNLRAPKVRISAHSLACSAIDWHPDGKHIASASSDMTVRVWDFSTAHKQKAKWELRTPYPVLNARWRPSCRSSMVADNGARLATQIATAYDRDNPMVHIWDFRRPNLPFREITPYSSAPTDLLWHTQDLLWTVGREGVFLQSDVQHAPKVIERRNLQAFALSSLGEINVVVQKRNVHRLSSTRLKDRADILTAQKRTKNLAFSVSPDGSVLSRSLTDDTLDRSFLCALPPHHQVRGDIVTKISYNQVVVLKLDEVLLNRKSYRPQQSAARGSLPYFESTLTLEYLAQRYTFSAMSEVEVGDEVMQASQAAFSTHEDAARAAGLYRLAQTWRILGFATIDQLKVRQKHKSETKDHLVFVEYSPTFWGDVARDMLLRRDSSPKFSPPSGKPIVTMDQQLGVHESTSNVPTPLAGPKRLPDPEDEVALPPSLTSTTAASPDLHPYTKPMAVRPSLTGRNLRVLQSDDIGDRVRDWDALLRLGESASAASLDKPPPLEKHDSDESFGFLGTFTDSNGSSVLGSLESEGLISDVKTKPTSSQETLSRRSEPTQVPSGAVQRVAALDRQSLFSHQRLQQNTAEQVVKREPDLESCSPFTVVAMLNELLTYFTANGDAQTAAHLVFLVAPLLPQTHPIHAVQARTITAIYTDTYLATERDNEDISSLINTNIAPMMQAGLNPLQVESIFSTYHEALLSHQLLPEAAQLRKIAFPIYPSVYEDFTTDNEVRLMCSTCSTAISTGSNRLQCGKCQKHRAACSICLRCQTSPFGTSDLFTACPLCGHCGHLTCLMEWFGDGQGDGCPTEGCLCDCVDGPWRQHKADVARRTRVEREMEKAEKRVKSDNWKVKQSKAVTDVRASLVGASRGISA